MNNRPLRARFPLRSTRTVLITMALLGLLANLSCSKRQTLRRGADQQQESASRISLREAQNSQGLEELAAPQIESEKQPDYVFNEARDLFDINIAGADLAATLQALCDNFNYNLVIDPSIHDSISVNLKSVTLSKFLDITLSRRNYDYRFEDNFLYVDLRGLETRVFNLNYLNASRQILGVMTITGQGGGASGGLIPQSNTTLNTQAIVNLWNDISNTLREIVLTQGQEVTAAITAEGSFAGSDAASGHRLVVEPNSGVIQITADQQTMHSAAEFINALESSLQRQVLIEARFVEINLNNNFQAGLDWSMIPDLTSVSNLAGALAGGAAITQSINPAAREFQIGVSNQNINAIMTQQPAGGDQGGA